MREKLRLRYEDVSSLNPRLIYASFTRLCESGPDADQWASMPTPTLPFGLLDGCRYDGAYPGVPMPAQGDRGSGISLALGIMMALWNRERTGRGTKISSSLLANGLWANGNAVQGALVGAPCRSARHPKRRAVRSPTSMHTRPSMDPDDDRLRRIRIPDLARVLLGLPQIITDSRFKIRRRGAPTARPWRQSSAMPSSALDFEDSGFQAQSAGVPFAEIRRPPKPPRDEQAVHAGAIRRDREREPRCRAPSQAAGVHASRYDIAGAQARAALGAHTRRSPRASGPRGGRDRTLIGAGAVAGGRWLKRSRWI